MGRIFECIECEEMLDESEFYSDTTKRGVTKRCKVCFDIYKDYKERDVKEHCNWCFGYGVFPFDGIPLGIHEVKQEFPSEPCPYCGADYVQKKRSVVNKNNNPKYPW